MIQDGDGKEVKMLTDAQMELVTALGEARAQKKEWEEQEQRCRQALLSEVDDADILYYDGEYVASIENRTGSRFNRKLFQKDWPKLDSEYCVATESKVVNIISSVEGEQ